MAVQRFRLRPLLLLTLLLALPLAAAELADAAALERQGEAALVAANADRTRCVDAALLFGQARAIYHQAEQWDKVRELNAYIYWCKKRMNIDDLDRYLAGGGAARVSAEDARGLMSEAEAIVDQTVTRGEAREYLALAERFAAANPDKPFLVHVRFLEVAERFERVDTPTAIEAMRASSDALERFAGTLEAAKPRAVPPDVFQSAQRPEPGELPVPQRLELTTAINDVRERYPERFAFEAPSDKVATMHWLLEQARQSTDQSVACYALVDLAAELAVDRDVQDPMFVIRCADFVDATFAGVDPIGLKRSWLDRARGHAAAKAIATLLEDPDDRQAKAVAGTFLCFEADDWAGGLPLLAETGNEDLRRAADMERAGPSGPAQKRELAAAWLAVAKRNREHREAMRRRALRWYREALGGLSGLSREEVAAEIAALEAELPLLWHEIDWKNLDAAAWDRIAGDVIVCRAKHKVTNTGYRLAHGRVVRLVPHPDDRWAFDVDGKKIESTGYGVEGGGKGTGSMRASFEIKNGAKTFGLGKITGPGQIYLRPVFPSGVRAGYGAVRLKVVDHPPPE